MQKQKKQKIFFHRYLHKHLRDTGLSRFVLYTKLCIHESTLSKWLSNTRQPSAVAIKESIIALNATEEEQRAALWFVFFGDE